MSKVEKQDGPRLLKLAKVAKFTEISLIIYVCIGALQVVAQIASFFIGAPVGEPKNWDIPHLTTIFLLMGLALLSFIVFLVSAAGFLQWMFRAYRNLKKIEARGRPGCLKGSSVTWQSNSLAVSRDWKSVQQSTCPAPYLVWVPLCC